MADTSSVTIRVDSEDKRRAEQLFSSLGLNMSTAFNIFLKQALLCGGLPFSVSLHGSNDDYFYSSTNTAHLDRSIAQLNAGQGKVHDIIEVDDE